MNEIQRTYRGSAARTDHERLEGRKGPEKAIVIASVARAWEEELLLGELRALLRTSGAR